MKIYYISRTYPENTTGGAIIRKGSVDYLREEGFDVWIVVPNYKSNELIVSSSLKHILIPLKMNIRIASSLERIGIWDDYLKKWVDRSCKYLSSIVNKNDILFATSGGELGSIMIGSILKAKIKCKFIINFHDPLAYSWVNGKILDNKYHVSREKQEYKYCKNADLIICSSYVNAHSLSAKYPDLKSIIKVNYFGYIQPFSLSEEYLNDKLRIVYGGNFSILQKPELLGDILVNEDNVEAFFVGQFQKYELINKYRDKYNFVNSLPIKKYCDFLKQNVNVGFVSLANDYLGACVPSKIFDYINLGLPILGALPEGDAMDLINKNGYGIACKYDDLEGLKAAVLRLKHSEIRQEYRNKVLKDRDNWAMAERIKEVIEWIRDLA